MTVAANETGTTVPCTEHATLMVDECRSAESDLVRPDPEDWSIVQLSAPELAIPLTASASSSSIIEGGQGLRILLLLS